MLLYVYFRFSEVMDQMFLMVLGVVQGSFSYAWCSLRLCSCSLPTRMESLKMFPHHHDDHHHHHNLVFFFFGVILDYLDFSGGIFDL